MFLLVCFEQRNYDTLNNLQSMLRHWGFRCEVGGLHQL